MLAMSDMVLGKETVPANKIYLPSVLVEFTVSGGKEGKKLHQWPGI